MMKQMPPTHLLADILSTPTRESLLRAIDDALSVEVGAADVDRIRRIIPEHFLPATTELIDIVLGTRKASKLGKAHPGWWYTVKGAEQATHPVIAADHARRFIGCKHVVEVCTGVGMDTFALAGVAERITTFESDAVTAALAIGNIRAADLGNVEVRHESFDGTSVLPVFDGMWADPSRRRADGKRASGAKEYSPLLETLDEVGKRHPDAKVGIKCGPGDTLPLDLLTKYASEFIGFGSECRERVLWKNTGVPDFSVSLPALNRQWVPKSITEPLPIPVADDDLLAEPHAAIIASGSVGEFFREHRLRPIHPLIAYGVGRRSDIDVPSLREWADVFDVIRVDNGISIRRIQQNLRDLRWNNRTEFKKRGWNGEPEELRRQLTFSSSNNIGAVIIARTETGHLTLYCKRTA